MKEYFEKRLRGRVSKFGKGQRRIQIKCCSLDTGCLAEDKFGILIFGGEDA